MKETTERHSPERIRTVEERVIDAMHRYAYVSAVEYARPSDRLLEIGFGEGYGSEIVGPRVAEYVGVEVDDDAVLHAARTYQDLNRSFLRYDGARLPFDDGTFDLIISFQVIEHVDNPAGFLEEARRVMKATGSALIVTPNRNHRVLDGERPFNRYHVREFNPPELEALMREAFENVVLFGIHGSSAMSEIEKRRVAKARRLARLDPLGLRYVIPESIDTRLRGWLRRRSSPQTSSAATEIGAAFMHRTVDDVATSLDLMAVGSG